MKFSFCVVGLMAGAFAFVANAQPQGQRAVPHIAYVYPAGGQQGSTFTLAIGGQLLNGATHAYFSGAGIRARVTGYDRPLTQKELNELREKLQELQDKRVAARADATKPAFTAADEKTLAEIRTKLAGRPSRPANPALAETVTLEISVAADAVPGPRELRLKTATGLSNPLAFSVGLLPENTAPVVTATMMGSRREAENPERRVALPTVVNGQILPGEVDRFRFRAAKGQRLTITAAARTLNPYLADTVPGWFQATLALYDATGREVDYADDYRFQPDPVLLFAAPADGEYVLEIKDAIFRGREDFVYRIALGELPFVASIFPLGGRAGGPIVFEATGWNLPTTRLVVDGSDKSRGVYELTVDNPSGLSNPATFAVDEQAATPEAERNNAAAEAQALSLPAIVDGRIGAAGDVDVFSFTAKSGSALVAEIFARRLQSPLDSILEVTDAAGKRVAFNDDWEDKGAGLLTHQSDSRVAFTVPADGTYFVRVADGQRRGGAEYSYRLRLGEPRPDFALRVVPATINLRAGTSAPVTVYALRRDGFAGEIALGLLKPPPGFMLNGGRIPAQQDQAQFTLTAPLNASKEPVNLRVVGVATIGDKRIAHGAAPAEDMMQAFAYHHLVTAQTWSVDITGRGPGFRPMMRGVVRIPAGGTARITIATGARASDVQFQLAEPIPGLTIKECRSSRDSVEVVIACDATQLKGRTEGNLILRAERRDGAQGPSGRGQRAALGFAPAIPFQITPARPPDT